MNIKFAFINKTFTNIILKDYEVLSSIVMTDFICKGKPSGKHLVSYLKNQNHPKQISFSLKKELK